MISAIFLEREAPYQRHSATSQAASAAIEPRAGTQRHRVLMHLRDMEDCGATDEEIQRTLPMSANSQRPRRQELVKAGLVVDSGRTRKTYAYLDAVVWIASEFAA
ncbi:MAG: hypothetical protein JJD98_00375 [Polaromonas sp.]|nr:hypothetical protein [Polaromonas sp.]